MPSEARPSAMQQISIEIAAADRKCRELREAVREMRRIQGKINRTERDAAICDQMTQRIRSYGLAVPEEWIGWAW